VRRTRLDGERGQAQPGDRQGGGGAIDLDDPSGKYVYVSNRVHNSIAAFKWDGSKLAPIGHATEGINIPRNFNIDPTGKWMLVANQDGNDVVVFEVGEDGLPKPTGHKVAVPRPVCVKFLAKP
jgi:6-phosphogluconolactonase